MIPMGLRCHAGEPKIPESPFQTQESVIVLLNQLLSPKESLRFQVLGKAKNELRSVSYKDIERVLTTLRKKNVSTLIFVLMETKNSSIYNLQLPARLVTEDSAGSFPNIAYYYATVNPQRGLTELFRLYKEHSDQRLAICQAIGKVGISEALEFLMAEAKIQKNKGSSIIPFLAGLKCSNKIIDKTWIVWFLKQDLDREEIILLSHLKTMFEQNELISLYYTGERERKYAIQHIFHRPVVNFEALHCITDKEIENKQYDKVFQWMKSDSIQRCDDLRVKKYQVSVIEQIKEEQLRSTTIYIPGN